MPQDLKMDATFEDELRRWFNLYYADCTADTTEFIHLFQEFLDDQKFDLTTVIQHR